MNKGNEIRAIVIKKLREFGYDPSTIIFYDGYIIEILGDKMKDYEVDEINDLCGSALLQFIRSCKGKMNGIYDERGKYYSYIFISRGNGYKSRKRVDDMSAWSFWNRLSYFNQ